jgi:GNAT superfamily N-acetyltransferase
MPDALTAVRLAPQDLPRIQGFDCGAEPYQSDLAAWPGAEAETCIGEGTKVWMYVARDGVVVGYGSLGATNWRYPDAKAKRIPVFIIPAVALRKEFWGRPADAPKDDRYSSQVMRHLLAEAAGWPGSPSAIGLYVHPENEAAIKLYERFGFQAFHTAYTDPATQVRYRGYVRPLARGE